MLHQPDPDAKPDMYKGIVAIRELHMAALRDYDFSCADEMLYPENYRYLSDLLSYVAIGARSVENQQHRLTASGIEVTVGMKNPTGGDLSVMMNAIVEPFRPTADSQTIDELVPNRLDAAPKSSQNPYLGQL